MKRRFVLLPLLAVPGLAGAQLLPSSGDLLFPTDDQYIGQDECSEPAQMRLSWLVDLGTNNYPLDPQYAIYASNDSVCDDSGTGDLVRTVATAISGGTTRRIESYPADPSDLTAADFIGDPLLYDCNDAVDRTVYVCVRLTSGTGGTVLGEAFGSFELQLADPNPPTNVSVRPSEDALVVSWTASTGAVNVKDYQACATNASNPADVRCSGFVTGNSTRIEGLVNGTLYDVTVVSRSLGDNVSDPASAPAAVAPVAIDDFWEHYANSGGQEEGGCTSGGGAGLLAFLGALALRAAGRRRP